LRVVQLQPDAPQAIALVRDTLAATPGAYLKRPEVVAARALLEQYPSKDTSRSDRVTWLMPGKDWQVQGFGVPVPPYDRLVFKQAIGMAVSSGTVLVDRAAVKDALEVFVQAEDGTLLPADPRRIREVAGELVLLTVSGVVFEEPASADPNAPLQPDRDVTVGHLPLYEEMGGQARQVASQMSGDGLGVVAPLLPGDAAGPVMFAETDLAGFLLGKTDPFVDGGGKDVFVSAKELRSVLKPSPTRSPTSRPGACSLVKVAGARVVVLGTFGETLGEAAPAARTIRP
jgi:hypothetical protein